MASVKLLGGGGGGLFGGSSSGGGGLFSGGSGGASGLGEAALVSTGAVDANPCPCCKLTFKQRLIGFVSCFSVGMLLSFLSTMSIMDPVRFGVLYTFGNVVALFSTAFLMGPWRQIKNMFHSKRIVATLIYLATLIATLVVAFTTESIPGVLILIIVQFCALVWYTASYIPFAREAIIKVLTGCFR